MEHTTESIWNACCCKIKSFILKHVSDEYITEEIFQEVFIKIHMNINALRDESKINNWIFQLTRNTITDYYRKHKIKFEEEDKIDIVESSNFDYPDEFKDENERDLADEIKSSLRPLIETLPHKYAQALLLIEYEGVSQVELAKRLKISPSGAKSRVQRARKMIQDKLMTCCHYEFDKYGTVIGVKPKECCLCNGQ
jgi:RNA polymerase sigma-70 factor (ECF subfamily)